jgi:hypothetical protein
MTTIFDVWQFINFVTDKVLQGYVDPDDISRALDVGQQQLYQHYWTSFYGKDQTLVDALIPFERTANGTTTSGGVLSYPADYGHVLGVYTIIDGRKTSVEQSLHSELDYFLNSKIYPIESNPRFLTESNGLHVYPERVMDVQLHYLAKPTTPVIGYTMNGNEPVYNPGASVQLEFSNNYWMQIIQLSLPYIGVNLNAPEVAGLFQQFNPATT